MDREEIDTELQHVFRRSWQYVGHTGDLARPEGWFPARTAGTPLLVTRDAGGRLRSLVAVCRHQGAVINPPAGRGAAVRCAYHGWTYGLDGSLRSAPRFDRQPGFDPTHRALRELPVGTWGPFVFVAGDPVTPLAAALGDVPGRLAAAGVDVAGLIFERRARTRREANWKQCVENWLGGAGAGTLLHPATTLEWEPGGCWLDVGLFVPAGAGATERVVDRFRLAAPAGSAATGGTAAAEFRRRLREELGAR